MPVEFCFRYPDNTEEFGNTLVEEGEGGFVRDFSDGPEIITIENIDDQPGACIKFMPDEGPFEGVDHIDKLDDADLPEIDGELTLDETEQLELNVVNEEGENIVLIIRYAEPNQMTYKGLIPLGLIYPDIIPPRFR